MKKITNSILVVLSCVVMFGCAETRNSVFVENSSWHVNSNAATQHPGLHVAGGNSLAPAATADIIETSTDFYSAPEAVSSFFDWFKDDDNKVSYVYILTLNEDKRSESYKKYHLLSKQIKNNFMNFEPEISLGTFNNEHDYIIPEKNGEVDTHFSQHIMNIFNKSYHGDFKTDGPFIVMVNNLYYKDKEHGKERVNVHYLDCSNVPLDSIPHILSNLDQYTVKNVKSNQTDSNPDLLIKHFSFDLNNSDAKKAWLNLKSIRKNLKSI